MLMTHASAFVPSVSCHQGCFAAALQAMHAQQQQPVQHTDFILDAQEISSSKVGFILNAQEMSSSKVGFIFNAQETFSSKVGFILNAHEKCLAARQVSSGGRHRTYPVAVSCMHLCHGKLEAIMSRTLLMRHACLQHV